MKYRPTILNIASFGLIAYSHFTYWTSNSNDTEGWGMLALIVLTAGGILGLIIDLVVQKISENWVLNNGIEALILIGLYIFNLWQSREKTIVIPITKGMSQLFMGSKEQNHFLNQALILDTKLKYLSPEFYSLLLTKRLIFLEQKL